MPSLWALPLALAAAAALVAAFGARRLRVEAARLRSLGADLEARRMTRQPDR